MSPRGYGSNGSTPHSSNGSSYSTTSNMNGYGSSTNLANMGMSSLVAPAPFSGMNPFALPSCNSQGYSSSIVSPAK